MTAASITLGCPRMASSRSSRRWQQSQNSLTKRDILEFLAGRVAKWWIPDDVIFADAAAKTSVGKFNKRALREKFKRCELRVDASRV